MVNSGDLVKVIKRYGWDNDQCPYFEYDRARHGPKPGEIIMVGEVVKCNADEPWMNIKLYGQNLAWTMIVA